ncbi:MAG: hypothetical protein MH825_06885 [Cyanobacteria bacterium]|nr:hypothetical protein [Cyanobacteriota bacterium]
MNDWFQNLERWLDDLNQQLDSATEEAAQTVEGWLDHLDQTAADCDRAIGQWQRALGQELRDTWNWDTESAQRDWEALLELLWSPVGDLADTLNREWLTWEGDPNDPDPDADPNSVSGDGPFALSRPDHVWEHLTPKVDPAPNRYGACIGCANYHGHIYGGQILVCAIHPHGWDGTDCPDWTAPEEP